MPVTRQQFVLAFLAISIATGVVVWTRSRVKSPVKEAVAAALPAVTSSTEKPPRIDSPPNAAKLASPMNEAYDESVRLIAFQQDLGAPAAVVWDSSPVVEAADVETIAGAPTLHVAAMPDVTPLQPFRKPVPPAADPFESIEPGAGWSTARQQPDQTNVENFQVPPTTARYPLVRSLNVPSGKSDPLPAALAPIPAELLQNAAYGRRAVDRNQSVQPSDVALQDKQGATAHEAVPSQVNSIAIPQTGKVPADKHAFIDNASRYLPSEPRGQSSPSHVFNQATSGQPTSQASMRQRISNPFVTPPLIPGEVVVAPAISPSTELNLPAADRFGNELPAQQASESLEWNEARPSGVPASMPSFQQRGNRLFNSAPSGGDSDQPAAKKTGFFEQGTDRRSVQLASLAGATTAGTPTTAGAPTATPTRTATTEQSKLPAALIGTENFTLAEQPQLGAHWKDDRPQTDENAYLVEPILSDFSPTPVQPELPYDPYSQMDVYEGKTLNATQRPLVELGRPWYQLGQLSPGYNWLGKHNNVTPQFLIYGDTRTAIASNTQNADNISQIAFQANLDFDLKLTGTERLHMFISPLGDGVNNNRWLLDDDRFVEEYDANIDFGYFEGDLGAIVGGLTNQTLPFDLPIAVGVIPLLMQNGVWMEDAFLGAAATIPARNSPRFNISNMDITFFAGYDNINSDAFPGDNSAARMYGMASFIEAMNGYFEIDYAFLDDRTFDDRSYHNIGFGFTRRYGRLLSNSMRVIVNAGQSTDVVENTADGVLLLSENSLITGAPSTLVPYMNFFAGFDRPQSAARAGIAGGVLRNTGILFESDNLTNYPTLDPTANDTYGGALGLNLIADDFSQQLVVEMAMLGVMGEDTRRNASGPQYGLGFRYQLPLTNAVIFRADGMYGFLEDDHDVRGLRFELRHKY